MKEEQELRDRKSALDQARKLVTERQQKVMDQATVVSDLKMQLVELRQNIANNPTPEVSEDEDVDATPLGVPLAPPPAVPPAGPPENTPLNHTGDDMDDDLLEEANPPATKRKGEFGVIQVVRTDRNSSSGLLDWIASLFVKDSSTFKHCMNSMRGKSMPARLRPWNVLLLPALLQMMKIRVGDGWTVVCSKKRQNKKSLKGKNDLGKGGFFNSGKEKRSEKERKGEELCKESKDVKEAFFQEDRSLRSGPKSVSPKKTPLSFCCAGPTPVKSGFCCGRSQF